MPKAGQVRTPISGFSRAVSLFAVLPLRPAVWQRPGYSLLEVILALAVAALAASLAVPSMLRMIDSWQDRAVVREVVREMGNLRAGAVLSRTGLPRDAIEDALSAAIPDGWELSVSEGFAISPAGLCGAGRIALVSPRGRTVDLRTDAAPSCRLDTA